MAAILVINEQILIFYGTFYYYVYCNRGIVHKYTHLYSNTTRILRFKKCIFEICVRERFPRKAKGANQCFQTFSVINNTEYGLTIKNDEMLLIPTDDEQDISPATIQVFDNSTCVVTRP